MSCEITDEQIAEIEQSCMKWDGAGLPPANTLCEMRHSMSGLDSGWIKVKINYSSPHNIVATSIDGGIEFLAFTRRSQFRVYTDATILRRSKF